MIETFLAIAGDRAYVNNFSISEELYVLLPNKPKIGEYIWVFADIERFKNRINEMNSILQDIDKLPIEHFCDTLFGVTMSEEISLEEKSEISSIEKRISDFINNFNTTVVLIDFRKSKRHSYYFLISAKITNGVSLMCSTKHGAQIYGRKMNF